jgi:hypothetical protein
MTQQTKDTWLFGEMQLDLNESASKVYRRAFKIAEACGYFVEAFKDHIDIFGEDCPDQFKIINRLHIADKKIIKVTKLVYRYRYPQEDEYIQTSVLKDNNTWVKLD